MKGPSSHDAEQRDVLYAAYIPHERSGDELLGELIENRHRD